MMLTANQPGRYFGIQAGPFSGQFENLSSAVATPNKNRTVFRVQFNDGSGSEGLIWAKADIPTIK
jgi:hypothetical protein